MISPQQTGQNAAHASPGAESKTPLASRLEKFQRRQSELWRLTFLLLVVLAVVFAATTWSGARAIAHRFEALPIGLVVLVVLFGVYAWNRTSEISELRGLVRGLETRELSPPSDSQMDQLFTVISRSQQGFRDLIDSFDDVLLALSLEGEIRAVNRSFAELVGASFQDIIGKPVTDFLEEGSGEGQEMIRRAMPRFLERRHWSGMLQIRLKQQKTVHYFDCVAHAMVRGGQVHGLTILARNITALRKNEARFTELFETLQEGIYIITAAGRVLDVNPALVRMLGYDSKEELLEKQVSEIFPDPELRASMRREVDRQPVVEGREVVLVRKDGRKITCLNTAAAVRDASGAVVRYQGALMDITARREIERRLYKQQEFARRLIDNFPDLILVLDTNARYTFISPRLKDITGFDAMEEETLELGARAHPEDRGELRQRFDNVASGRETFESLEIRARHKSGDWRRLRCHLSPLVDERGKIEGVVISARDVTELKRLEEQLIQSEKLAAMGQMLAGVAHELNNPLTAILGVTELLRERSGPDEATKRQLDLTHRQARRAARIVQNLLEFSRPASPNKQPLDINSIIERALQLHEHSLRRNAVEVQFRPDPSLPAVVGDANQLIQVFLNLIANAEQAIREIRESGRIQIRAARVFDRVAITVQDDGVGIPPEAISRVFDPFFTTKRPGGGTGLGLSICLSLVREHGGSIEAESLPAGGSAFSVFLPIDSRAAGQADVFATPPLPEAALPPSADALKDRAVLVVDDEESIRMLLAEGLSIQGLLVDCAATVEEAIAAVSRRVYDVLLCDLNLSPTGAGRTTSAERILAACAEPKPRLIYMSGELMDAGEISAQPGNPCRLQKPFRIADVLGVIRETVN
jgi:two-component system NtrC family sensor kinase